MYDPNDENQQVAIGIVIMAIIFCFGWFMRGLFT